MKDGEQTVKKSGYGILNEFQVTLHVLLRVSEIKSYFHKILKSNFPNLIFLSHRRKKSESASCWCRQEKISGSGWTHCWSVYIYYQVIKSHFKPYLVMKIFRKRINLRPEEALFFFVNGSIPSTSNTMGEVKDFALQKI